MIIAVEDQLSEKIALAIVSKTRPEVVVSQVIGRQGNGYLRTKADSLNRTARGYPVFILTDLDNVERCPGNLRTDWLSSPPSRHLLFRVAQVEIEAWVMADRQGFARFLRIAASNVPENIDLLPDPKQTLLDLARRSPIKDLRGDILPRTGGTAKIGPAYNARLGQFVDADWNINRAIEESPSLARAVQRLKELDCRLN